MLEFAQLLTVKGKDGGWWMAQLCRTWLSESDQLEGNQCKQQI